MKKNASQKSSAKKIAKTEPLTGELCAVIMQESAQGIVVADSAGRVVEANLQACKALGYAKGGLNGLMLHLLFARTCPRFEQIKTGGKKRVKCRMVRKDGGAVMVNVFIQKITDGSFVLIIRHDEPQKYNRTEQALRESETRLRAIFESEPECIKLADADGNLVDMNAAGLAMVEADSLEQVKGKPVNATVTREFLPAFDEMTRAVFRGESRELEYEIVGMKGKRLWLETRSTPLRNAGGEIKYLLGVARDITERKRAEHELQENKAWLENIFNAIEEAVLVVTPDRELFNINKATERIFGYSLEEIRDYSTEILHVDREHYLEFGRRINEAFAQDKSAHFEFEAKRKNGEVFPTEHTVTLLKNKDGKPFGIVSVVRDMIERKQAELELQRARDQLESTLQAIPDLLFELGEDGTYLFFRARQTELLAAPPDQLFGRNIKNVLPPDAADIVFNAMREAKRNGSSFGKTYLLSLPTGERWFELSVARKSENLGDQAVFIVLSRDITQRKQAERALREHEAQLSLIFNSSSDMQILLRAETDDRFVAQACNRSYMHGVSLMFPNAPTNIIGMERREFLRECGVSAEMIEVEMPMYRAVVEKRVPVWYESEFPSHGGSVALEVSISPALDQNGKCTHILWNARNVTERKRAEEKIKASLEEKEVLLKEIHHRVKNNLQVISSLLYLQSQKSKTGELKNMFLESQNRIMSMSLIHEKLYQSADLAQVSFADYAHDLSNSLFQSYGVNQSRIQLHVEGGDVTLDVNNAVPCGLLLNEIISNSLKYAFPHNRPGEIRIALELGTNDRFILTISDDGVGMPSDFQNRSPLSLGVRLIERLAEQMQGSVERVSSENGTTYHISFPARSGDNLGL